MVAGHFEDDDEGGHRRLHHAGEIAGHAEDRRERDADAEQLSDAAAKTGADR